MKLTKREERRNIQINRLSYILIEIDNTEGKDRKTLQKMFDTLLDISFDENGIIRSTKNLYDHLQNIMINNNGGIPYFPDKSQITTIDEKCEAIKKLNPEKFEKYRRKLEDLLSSKSQNKNQKNDLLEPEEENKDLAKSFATMEQMNPGFLDVLGISDKKNKEGEKSDDKKENKKTEPSKSSQLQKSREKTNTNESLVDYLLRIF